MAVLYVAIAWVIMQVAGWFQDFSLLPEGAGEVLLTLLLIGFPIALLLSWFYQVTPDDISGDSLPRLPNGAAVGRTPDFVVIAVLAAALILFAVDKWWDPTPSEASVAVLPFHDMSIDQSQEYFADGLSAEILNTLTHVQYLRVISRSSSFSYKGRDVTSAQIAEELDVDHILDGTVTKIENQVRITAQLIEARSNSQVWTQTFDRDFEDVFAIQDEIAAAVVDALRIRLVREMPDTSTTDPEVYELYLHGKFLNIRSREYDCEQAGVLLGQALELDPLFVPAWTELSYFYLVACPDVPMDFDEITENGRYAAQQALTIEPNNALAHSLLARVAMNHDWDFRSAADHINKALEINSGDTRILVDAARLARIFNNLGEAVRLARRAAAREPTVPRHFHALGLYQYLSGEADKAIDSLRKALRLGPDSQDIRMELSMAYLALGDPQTALEIIREETNDAWRLTGEAIIQFELGATRESDAALQQMIEEHKDHYAYQIAWVYSSRGEIDEAFHWLDESYRIRDPGLSEVLAEPLLANLRDDPRWDQLVTKLGLVH